MDKDSKKIATLYLSGKGSSEFSTKDYQALSDQVLVHKYLINQGIPRTISWDEAAFSWAENVFTPIMQVVNRWEVRSAFPHKSLSELYFDISNHWYYLAEKDPTVSAQYAAIEYAATYGKGLGRFFSKLQIPHKVA